MNMSPVVRLLLPVLILARASQGEPASGADHDSAAAGSNPTATEPSRARFIEGKDYVVMERVRFLDRMGFDRPVEAFSLLFPKGWKTEGGIKWRGVQECRGEIVSPYLKASSPDGALTLEAFPVRSFGWTDDASLMQAMQTVAQQGGCRINQPFDARQYTEGFARQELGARASEIRNDDSRLPQFQQLDQQANDIARQFGNDSQQTTTITFGKLTWPDGTEGLMHVGVVNMILRRPDFLSGGVTTMTTTSVIQCTLIRFPAARQKEASDLLNTIMASHRTNPVWSAAKEKFLTELGQREHRQNMERIRLVGEQSKAYAQAQSAASDQRMRDWENRQASQDKSHKAFVQTIREVTTWKDGDSSVELTAGYDQAWSRGDGSYILSNSPSFDPSAVFLDQAWKPMKQAE